MAMYMPIKAASNHALRFALGARVECNMGSAWEVGTVVAHFYTQEGFPQGTCVPYQVALDDGRLIFARQDEDSIIKALLKEPDPAPSMLPQRENRGAVLSSLTSAFLHLAWAFALMQFGEYVASGHVPFAMRFAAAEMVVDGRLTFDGFGVSALAASFAVVGLQARGPSSSEWLDRSGLRSRSGAPDAAAIVLHAVFTSVGKETFFRGAIPALATKLFPENPNAVAAGLVMSIVGYFILHPAEYAFFAAFSGFWFAIAAYYGGVMAAILACFFAQAGASVLYLRRPPQDEMPEVPEAPVAAHLAPAKEEARAEADQNVDAEEEWEPMPMLDPYLPRPENRRMVLRSFRASCVYLGASFILAHAGGYLFGGAGPLAATDARSGPTTHASNATDIALGVGFVTGGALSVVGFALASCMAIVGGLDVFSAPGSKGYLHESATAWLNQARISTKAKQPDRSAVLLTAIFTAVGHETFFRYALPAFVATLSKQKLLPDTEHASNYGLAASVFAYFLLHPYELSFFAAFAGSWFAIAAACGGLLAAIIASAASQVGASSLYFHALRRSARAASAASEESKTEGQGKRGTNPKKSSKKQR